MEKLTHKEKRKLINAKYYAKKRKEKGEDKGLALSAAKLENKQLRLTIEKLKKRIKELESLGNWTDDED